MNSRSTTVARWLEIVVRVVLGAVFIYAGSVKIMAPEPLADSIASFAILPGALVVPLALGLPPFEIASGALLIIGWPRGIGAMAVLVVCAVFCIALGSALARGITVDCGCFGAGIPLRTKMWWDLGRDVLLLAGALFVYGYSRRELEPAAPGRPPRAIN
jgi:putative oxidoreductase